MSSICKHMILRSDKCHLVWKEKFIVKAKKKEIQKYSNYTHIFCKRRECVEHLGLQILDQYPDDFFFENQCSICLENIKKEDSYKSDSCGHIFHKNCLKQWINSSQSIDYDESKSVNQTCPLCRSKMNTIETGFKTINLIDMTLNFRGERPIYFSPQTIILDGEKIFISGEKLYKLFKSSPSKWAIHDSDYFQPIYEVGQGKFISSWLRIILLFANKKTIVAETQDTLDSSYIKSVDNTFTCGQHTVSYDSYFKIFNWVFDVMHDIKHSRGLEFSLNLNSKIINIIFAVFSNIEITSKTYQLVALCAMHIVHNEVLDYAYLNDFTTNIYTTEKIKDFTQIVKKVIKPYGLC